MEQAKGVKYARALAVLDRCERKLVAAQNRWQKARAAVKRHEVRIDREAMEVPQ